MNGEQLAQVLGDYTTERDGIFKVCCPAHDDTNPSLEITEKNGKVVFICRAGCSQENVIIALRERGIRPPTDKLYQKQSVKQKVVAQYYYRDENGKVIYWKERLEPGKDGRKKDFRFRHTDPVTGADVFSHGKHNPHILYNRDKIDDATLVHLFEGEKQADVATEWGFVGTSLDTGAKESLSDEMKTSLDALAGKNVALYPDNDLLGRTYMASVAKYLYGKVKKIKIVNLPNLPEKGDICDWKVIAGNDKALLLSILKELPEWTPQESTKEDSYSGTTLAQDQDNWPVLPDSAMPGWIGDFVRHACEHSEADPAAVLVTLLCRFAAEIGSGPYVNVGDAKHRARTNAVIVGASSKARKGTSAKPVERLFSEIPSGARCTPGPLSSGEGLIYAVRDETQEYDKKTQEYIVADPGVADKRLFVLDEEFAAALNCTRREGNTLSAIIRGFYDDGNAEPLTKSVRIKATGAHVVIVTHIVELELTSLLNQVQMSNGFGNRFLWILSRRQKLMALPSPMSDILVARIRDTVKQRLASASSLQTVRMSNDAAGLWIDSYPRLTMDYEGVAGSIVNRTEAHAVRLALIYSLCAGHSEIEVDDLSAALALVEYSRTSAFKIFGSATGDKKKAKILDALKTAGSKGMTVTEISAEVFSKNMESKELHKLLTEMDSSKLIATETIPTGGAPKTVVKLASVLRSNEINELTPGSLQLNSFNSLIRTSQDEILSFTEADFDGGLPL